MALSPTLINKLELIKKDLHEVSNKKFTFTEEMKGENIDDVATLVTSLTRDCILIKRIEDNTLGIFDHQSCADFLILEFVDSYNVKLHVFEFKRTVRCNKGGWPQHITDQFLGGYINALALAGYLNINIVDIAVYTCYRFDKVSPKTDTSFLRVAASESAQSNRVDIPEKILNWLNSTPIVIFDKDGESKIATHTKIELDKKSISASIFI